MSNEKIWGENSLDNERMHSAVFYSKICNAEGREEEGGVGFTLQPIPK